MNSYTAQQLREADIRITEIHRIWRVETSHWQRNRTYPRTCEGLLFFEHGSIEYDFGDFTFLAVPGQAVKLPAGIPYCGIQRSAPIRVLAVDFSTAQPGEFRRYPFPTVFTPANSEEIHNMFAALENTWHRQALCYRCECMGQLYRLCAALARDAVTPRPEPDSRQKALQISDFIRENAHRPELTAEEIARHFHISPTHLRRIFRSQLNTSPAAALASVRLENAKRMLIARRDLPIGEVAQLCGYRSVYYFSQVFRDAEGLSPSRWRVSRLTQL